ncbi:hypothetical protein ACQW5G_01295 [Fructilactobacillus sp. Tb1]|uniref:hypothetical protein n=1 Tax=Fructilactobacillus sp. Tb1 TaxID=3422304 RepID=UPI003D2C7A82
MTETVLIKTNKIKQLRRKIANAETRALNTKVAQKNKEGKYVLIGKCKKIDELKAELQEEANKL